MTRPHVASFLRPACGPEGAQAPLGAARREAIIRPHVASLLPPEGGAQAPLGAARREA